MTTLPKRKNRRRHLNPLSERMFPTLNNRLLSPWDYRMFPSHFNVLQHALKVDDKTNGDFFEEDSLMPAMNVKDNKDEYEIELAAPGFRKKDFELTIEDNVLHISAEKKEKKDDKDENYTCKEFSYKSFMRSLTLPDSVDLDQNINATYTDGILKVNVLKKEDAKQPASKKVIEIS